MNAAALPVNAPARSLRARLASGAAWSAAGAVVSRGLSLVGSVVAARLLGQEQFGGLGVVQTTIGMFVVFAVFGVGVTATKHVAEWRVTQPARAARIIDLTGRVAFVAGLISTVLLWVLAPWLAEHSLGEAALTPALRAAAGSLLLASMQGAELGALTGLEAFKGAALANVLGSIAGFPFLVGGVWLGGVVGGAWGLTASSATLWFALRWFRIREQRRAALVADDRPLELGLVWSFSVPSVLAGALVAPVTWLCTAALVRTPDGLAQMGLFSAANQWYQAALFLPSMIAQAVMPMFAERLGAGDARRSRQLLFGAVLVNGLCVLPVVLAATFGRTLLMEVYGKDFAAGGPTLSISILTAGLVALQTPVGQFLTAKGRIWLGLLSNLLWGAVFYAATLHFVTGGSVGLATARLIAYGLSAVWVLAAVWWLTKDDAQVAA